jgi:carbamoyltransferase
MQAPHGLVSQERERVQGSPEPQEGLVGEGVGPLGEEAGLHPLEPAFDLPEYEVVGNSYYIAVGRIRRPEEGSGRANWPVTDAFGTRREPEALLSGLGSLLGRGFRLVLHDEGVVLEVSSEIRRGSRLEPALAWLKDRFVWLSVDHAPLKGPARNPGRLRDERRIPVRTVALAELHPDGAAEPAVLAGLLARLGPALGHRETVRMSLDGRGRLEGPGPDRAGPFVLSWSRGAEVAGLRPGRFLAAARDRDSLLWFAEALQDAPGPAPQGFRLLIDGLEWGVLRRPCAAVPAPGPAQIIVSSRLCARCGLCARVCPADCIQEGGTPRPGRAGSCLRCFECVEACPCDALRPAYTHTSAMRGEKLRPGWLSRLRGRPGPALPALHPPSYLLPKRRPRRRPRYVLGLSVATMQEHAAALFRDGRLVGAVEEERLARVRHYGWPPPDAPPTCFPIEEGFCRRAIRGLLEQGGVTLDDVDVIAVNGLPARYSRAYVDAPPERPLPVLRSGRLMFIPHHLCHAASAYRVSGLRDAWVLTVDGRGERQTAAVFRGLGTSLRQVYALRSLMWRSIGGVYESVTRLLGFGAHGQGVVMALASLGRPRLPLARYLSWTGPETMSISETVSEALRRFARDEDSPLLPAHRDLAASLQAALEKTVASILARFIKGRPRALCLAGGVALNCRMNEALRRRFLPEAMFVQPAANDAGTALGAALEACARLDSSFQPAAMKDALLGPAFSEADIRAALEGAGLRFVRPRDLCAEAAGLLAQGKVLGWFQGRMEFGPRALGGRSIIADPRPSGMHSRVNRIKDRHPWRPFGPSILAGREGEWFAGGFDSRFMLFTVPVLKERASRIPAVLHSDGTTRPQSVHRDRQPLYHRLIREFERLTGVPMILNTSFNRRGEPIVCTPQDAVAAFSGLGLDALVIGPFIASRRPAGPVPRPDAASLRALPGGRRLALRLTTDCDCACAHCTIRDLRGLPARSLEGALRAVAQGRRARCDELVLMRGEPAFWPGLPELAARAREMGYRFIQLQTSGRAFARPGLRERLLEAVDAAEVMVLGPDEATHDRLSGVSGSFRQALMGMKVLLGAGKEVLPSVPVLRDNLERLAAVPPLLGRLGARRVQFNFPRPVQLPRDVVLSPLARLSEAGRAVARAAEAAAALGMDVCTEGLPWCHLPEGLRRGTESAAQWDRFRVDDLRGLHDRFGGQLREARPLPPPCRVCPARAACPRTWPLYLEVFGSSELRPLSP